MIRFTLLLVSSLYFLSLAHAGHSVSKCQRPHSVSRAVDLLAERVPSLVQPMIWPHVHPNLHPENPTISRLYEKAIHGDAEAQYQLGQKYDFLQPDFLEKGIQVDDEEAFFWYTHSANQGFKDGILAQGYGFLGMKRGKKNYQKAFENFSQVAAQGNVLGKFALGQIHEVGYGVIPADLKEARKNYQEILETGPPFLVNLTRVRMARIYFKTYKFAEASALLNLLGASTRQNQALMGLAYEKGMGIAASPAEALLAYFRGIDRKDFSCYYQLAVLYSSGIIVKKNEQQAIEYFREFFTAQLKQTPDLDESDFSILASLQLREKETFDPQVKINMKKGLDLAKGSRNVPSMPVPEASNLHPENQLVTRLYQQAKFGDAQAQYRLGALYHGDVLGKTPLQVLKKIARNDEEAFYWILQAAKQDHGEAQTLLSRAYFGEFKGKKNYQKAFMIILKAATAGSVDAKVALGRMFELGYGVLNQDLDQARALYLENRESSPWVALFLARVMIHQEDFESARALVFQKREQQNLHTETIRGLLTEFGLGEREGGPAAAVMSYFKGSGKTMGHADFHFGILYALGKIVEQDEEAAFIYFCKAFQKWLSLYPDLAQEDLPYFVQSVSREKEARNPKVRALIERALETVLKKAKT